MGNATNRSNHTPLKMIHFCPLKTELCNCWKRANNQTDAMSTKIMQIYLMSSPLSQLILQPKLSMGLRHKAGCSKIFIQYIISVYFILLITDNETKIISRAQQTQRLGLADTSSALQHRAQRLFWPKLKTATKIVDMEEHLGPQKTQV